ncbi:MAG: relaxase domain-containing protein, partial [Stenotrophomonas sp.]|uniref:relaxase domain-containing protein n=1 Tax=Stenotrophomonas sp. TaxID=69392 RepID=UPI003D6D75C9
MEKVAASGLLAVGFDHRTSRPGDPLLHTHVIVVNRALGPDERCDLPLTFRTVDPLRLYWSEKDKRCHNLAENSLPSSGKKPSRW